MTSPCPCGWDPRCKMTGVGHLITCHKAYTIGWLQVFSTPIGVFSPLLVNFCELKFANHQIRFDIPVKVTSRVHLFSAVVWTCPSSPTLPRISVLASTKRIADIRGSRTSSGSWKVSASYAVGPVLITTWDPGDVSFYVRRVLSHIVLATRERETKPTAICVLISLARNTVNMVFTPPKRSRLDHKSWQESARELASRARKLGKACSKPLSRSSLTDRWVPVLGMAGRSWASLGEVLGATWRISCLTSQPTVAMIGTTRSEDFRSCSYKCSFQF